MTLEPQLGSTALGRADVSWKYIIGTQSLHALQVRALAQEDASRPIPKQLEMELIIKCADISNVLTPTLSRCVGDVPDTRGNTRDVLDTPGRVLDTPG
jgi:hypothetical protein